MTALTLTGLRVEATATRRAIVDDVSLSLEGGQTLAIVGESGSGKTTTALALLGYARPGMRITAGNLTIGGTAMPLRHEVAARRLRGKVVSHVPQEPGTSLNPSLRIGDALGDILRAHLREGSRDDAATRALESVNLPTAVDFRRRFPHQLSGGQQQRVMIAMALSCRPGLVVLDEPTTGLDVVTQAHVLAEIKALHDEHDIAMVYVSHDLAVVAQIADRIAVMHEGRIVEEGAARDVLYIARHPYTRALIEAVPDHLAPPVQRAAAQATDVPLLSVERLDAVHQSQHDTVVAASDVSFTVARGECVGLVGESGSGKTTVARCIAGLHVPAGGRILLDGEPLGARARDRTREQRRRCQIVFQNPYESLNPRRRVGDEIARSAIVLRGLDRRAARAEVARLLELVRLPAAVAGRFPRELSGGERQRVAIARAAVAQPDLIVCDEITSALDVSVQRTVLELLRDLRETLGLSLLFITHDLGVVASIADRVLVFDRGRICEEGPVSQVFLSPSHPRSQELLAAAPRLAR